MNTNRIANNNPSLSTLAIARTPYSEKFAVPRQPGLAPSILSRIELTAEYNHEDFVRGLDEFSHLWLSFIFHETQAQGWKPLVRPPRLGGNRKIGVFASRSPFRPNHLGLSVVKLEAIENHNKQVCLIVSGADLVDGTPIVDIKPYVPYVDSVADATGGFAPDAPTTTSVIFSDHAEQQLQHIHNGRDIRQSIIEVIQQKPQPAYKTSETSYGMTLYGLNIRWHWDGTRALVTTVTAI